MTNDCLRLHVQTSAPEPEESFNAEFALNVLWLDKSIGLAVDQTFKNVRLSPNPHVYGVAKHAADHV